jgi:hypothetical protein
MITNTGKQIIGRYLVGLTDTYASHLVLGCGPKPLSSTEPFADYASKTSMDFEMIRVPITSRNIVTESGATTVIFTAELPTTERYGITEIGVYPSVANPTPVGSDSKSLALFSFGENWKYHTSGGTITDVPEQTGNITDTNNNITIADDSFFTTSENALFENVNNPARITKHEQPRYLSSVLLMRGDTSSLTVNGNDLSASGNHIHLETTDLGISQNSSDDEIRLAFSVINKDGVDNSNVPSPDVPSNIKVLVQFAHTDGASPEYASFVVNLNNGTNINTQTPTGTTNITMTTANAHNISVGQKVTLSGLTPSAYNGTWTAQSGTTGSTLVLDIGYNPGAITVAGRATSETQHNFTNNRYVVAKKTMGSLYKTAGFAWADVRYIKVFVDAEDTLGSAAASDFYIALDALRIENVSSFNNKYGLTAYTVVKSSDSLPITKLNNTKSFIEFKFVVDVL